MKWVKGHNKDKFNEEADFYAQHAATCLNRLNDEYYNYSKKSWKSLVSRYST